ncbi:RIP metalloprotease RseP [Lentilactobacillus senioris]|uniref:RIP metalloprotease RseP n=1 Tax=Lentilactobacillus senioris TaxID=931534 RepID=UPI00227F071F|nr:RIP metalloprotease RseP [Lentilactobacillus senioris]MCY9806756.1 RIP metalloprotease RseP [Lentilactobacillus senioris]
MITTIIVFIIVFGILVVFHEFGHYIMAKRSGILVREFSIGMGPKVFYYRKNETTFTLRLLPIGGYVRMAGSADDEDEEIKPGTPATLQLDDNNRVSSINISNKTSLFQGIPLTITNSDLEEDLWIEGYENGDESEVKRFNVDHDATIVESDGVEVQIAPKDVQFQSASLKNRMLTNFAGVFNNFLLAIIVYTILGFVQGGVITNTNKIDVMSHDSVAKDAGIKSGDRIIAVEGHKTNDWQSVATQIQTRPGKKTDITISRNGKTKQIELTPKKQTTNGKSVGVIGVTQQLDHSFKAKILSGFTQSWSMTKQLFTAIVSMFTGHFSLNDLGGPVAIFATTSQATKLGITGILSFLGFLSLNLGIVNLIPIPGLDGGKLVLNIIEAIRRKPVSEKTETVITLIGFAFLMILMILVTWNDIQRYFLH